MQFSWGYAAPLLMEAALAQGVFDLLDAGPKTVDEVAAASKASVRGLRAIMDALVGLRLLAKEPGGLYALTPESAAFLVSSKPGFLGGVLRHCSNQLIPNWLSLNQVVREGKPARPVNGQTDGVEFFKQFVEDIFPMSYPAATALAANLKLEQEENPVSVLDLAAGSGVWGIALAQASPLVRVTAVDWPDVLSVTRKMTDRFGVTDRFTFTGGDLRDADFGSNHQIATLGHILHSEGEQRSRELLRKTAAALAPGGTIAIAEFLVDENRETSEMGLIFAVNMLVMTDEGSTYSFREIAEWLEATGFENPRAMDAPGPSPLILATRK
jgi:ubiquinone/menaquinone biosynthesis C-methylase UbiE